MNPNPEQEQYTFRVSDLKQYIYCPRVAYYQLVLPGVRPVTYKMTHGIESHIQTEGSERRRSLRAYGLDAGERKFNVPLWSSALGLSGELDMLIETGTERIPVDYKDSSKIGPHFKLQLMAYGRLLEVMSPDDERSIRRGFLYLIPDRKALEVTFTPKLRKELERALEEVHHMAYNQRMPGPTRQQRRCIDCEFRRFCNDID